MLIKEFKEYNLIEKMMDDFREVFPHVRLSGNFILASSLLDRSGKPIVRIDSKQPLIALMLKFGDGFVEIKSIVNSSGIPGLSSKVIDVILRHIDDRYTIFIDQDVSGGFWDRIMEKHPEYRWVKK
jgi:hypothetical protein